MHPVPYTQSVVVVVVVVVSHGITLNSQPRQISKYYQLQLSSIQHLPHYYTQSTGMPSAHRTVQIVRVVVVVVVATHCTLSHLLKHILLYCAH